MFMFTIDQEQKQFQAMCILGHQGTTLCTLQETQSMHLETCHLLQLLLEGSITLFLLLCYNVMTILGLLLSTRNMKLNRMLKKGNLTTLYMAQVAVLREMVISMRSTPVHIVQQLLSVKMIMNRSPYLYQIMSLIIPFMELERMMRMHINITSQ